MRLGSCYQSADIGGNKNYRHVSNVLLTHFMFDIMSKVCHTPVRLFICLSIYLLYNIASGTTREHRSYFYLTLSFSRG